MRYPYRDSSARVVSPYSEREYGKAKSMGLDLDVKKDFIKFYNLS